MTLRKTERPATCCKVCEPQNSDQLGRLIDFQDYRNPSRASRPKTDQSVANVAHSGQGCSKTRIQGRKSSKNAREEFEAWTKYLAARDQAEKSQDIRDGIVAGKAWAEFLDLFVRQNGAEQ